MLAEIRISAMFQNHIVHQSWCCDKVWCVIVICLINVIQSTWRKIQALGLVPAYRENEEVKLFCGKIDALAFLPLAEVEAGLILLQNTMPQGIQSII